MYIKFCFFFFVHKILNIFVSLTTSLFSTVVYRFVHNRVISSIHYSNINATTNAPFPFSICPGSTYQSIQLAGTCW